MKAKYSLLLLVFLLSFCWSIILSIISDYLLNKKCTKRYLSANSVASYIPSTALFISAFYFLPLHLFLTSILFFSVLLIVIKTDLEQMLISEATTLFLIPFGFALSYAGYTWASWQMSLAGAAIGYAVLWLVNKTFYLLKNQEGIGEGDMDLLAMVGSFTGLIGIWFVILFASVTASVVGIITMAATKNKNVILPFGPFIAISAIVFVFFNSFILDFFYALFI